MHRHSIYDHSSIAKNCPIVVICAITLLIQGCAAPVRRGISVQEAKQVVINHVGTTKPSDTTLGKYYQEIETYILQDGRTYSCNHKPTRIKINNLTLRTGEDNSFEGSIDTTGDCSSAGAAPTVVAGRYNEKYLYLYFPYNQTTYINKFEIRKKKGRYDDDKLLWLGNYKYIDDVWSFDKAYETFEVLEKNDYMAKEIYKREDYTRKNQDPNSTASNLYKELDQNARTDANSAASYARKLNAEINQARSESDAYLSGYIQQKGAENAAALADIDRQTNAAYAETNRRLAEQAQERERAKADQEAKEAERRREADRAKAARAAAKDEATRKQQLESQAAAAQKEADDNSRKVAKERVQEKLEAERVAKEEKRKQEQERIAAAKAKKSAKEAQDNADKKAKVDYLQALTQQTQLRARTCPDGKGSYYIVGKRPSISPKVVDCIDVSYRAYCQGSGVASSTGTIKNFLGASTDCFMGDAAEISPKPSCAIGQVSIEVISVRGCGG